jgi:hypothetical protein
MTPEGKVKKKVAAMLKDAGAWYFMPVIGPYGTSGIPDFIGCHNGRFFGIETKANTGKMTALQHMQARGIVVAAGAFFLITDQNEVGIRSLEQWLTRT